MGAGLIPPPKSDAVRHHYVPQFVMRRFAVKGAPKEILRLSKRTGRSERLQIRVANQEEYLYAGVEREDRDNRIEGLLALTEDSAAPALERLLDGDGLTEDDALPLSLLLGLQQTRSPIALDAVGNLIEAEGRAQFEAIVRDRGAFASFLQAGAERAIDPLEAEASRQAMLKIIEAGGGLRLGAKRNAGLVSMVDTYVEAGLAVGHADWHVLHSEDWPFALNDVGFARFDEKDRLPVSRGLLYPLASGVCLAVAPPSDEGTQVSRWACKRGEVRTINLRMYGWAHEYILGESQHVVTSVRAQARQARFKARAPSLEDRAPGGP